MKRMMLGLTFLLVTCGPLTAHAQTELIDGCIERCEVIRDQCADECSTDDYRPAFPCYTDLCRQQQEMSAHVSGAFTRSCKNRCQRQHLECRSDCRLQGLEE